MAGAAACTKSAGHHLVAANYHGSPMGTVLRIAAPFALVAAVTISALAATPGTARACSCSTDPLEPTGGEVAFAGRQVSRVILDADNGSDPTALSAVLVFEVDRVYRGSVGPRINLRTHELDAMCGVDFTGEPIVGIGAFRDSRSGELAVHLCFSNFEIHYLEEVLGGGYPPDSSIEVPDLDHESTSVDTQTGDTPEGEEDAGREEDPGRKEDRGQARTVALVVGLVLVVAITFPTLWLIASRRRARRSASEAESPEDGA